MRPVTRTFSLSKQWQTVFSGLKRLADRFYLRNRLAAVVVEVIDHPESNAILRSRVMWSVVKLWRILVCQIPVFQKTSVKVDRNNFFSSNQHIFSWLIETSQIVCQNREGCNYFFQSTRSRWKCHCVLANMHWIFDMTTLIHRIHCVRRLNCVHWYDVEHAESNAYLRSRIGCTVAELWKILSWNMTFFRENSVDSVVYDFLFWDNDIFQCLVERHQMLCLHGEEFKNFDRSTVEWRNFHYVSHSKENFRFEDTDSSNSLRSSVELCPLVRSRTRWIWCRFQI